MSLLDAANQAAPSKTPRYFFLAIIVVLLIVFFVWRAVRYDAEERTVDTFFSTLSSGNMQQAYQLWKAMPSYSFQDFEEDWGPNGYYGPVKSFRIDSAFAPKKSSSVAVRVLISPYQPFPKNDSAQQSRTREVTIWVDRNTHSLSFPPPAMSQLIRATPPPALLASM